MRWQSSRRSENVENRGRGGGAIALGGGGTLVLALVVFLMGGDPTSLLLNQSANYSQLSPQQQAEQEDFATAVLGNTEDVWKTQFSKINRAYQEPKLILFSGSVESACGYAGSAMGPFYCPLDQKLYLDLEFFAELEQNLNAPGDFARAYVIAHEVGHHIQKLLGTEDKVRQRMGRASSAQRNALSVKLELQADCYAGLWGHYAQADYNLLEQGDIEEALNAASRIGDDALQKKSQGYVVPDSFTHGTSAQRYQWFSTGLKSGQLNACDTFRS